MRKKLFGLAGALLALTAALCVAPGGVALADEAHTHCICGGEVTVGDHTTHKDVIWMPWNDSTSLPTAAGSYYLTQNVTLSSTWEVKADIDLCLNGKNITGAAGTDTVSVASGASLDITDCHETVGKITHNSGETGRGVYNNGALTLWNGSIAGNRLTGKNDAGGGVWNIGSLILCGGSIADNSTTGEYGYGGGVCNGTQGYGSTLIMCGGSIENNTTAAEGGGVYVGGDLGPQRLFTMSGTARISGNRADCGGGVYIERDTAFTMSGTAAISGNVSWTAGGVQICSVSTFEMRDSAAITGNTGTGGVGGVKCEGGSLFTMCGGTIACNNGYCGGVEVHRHSGFIMSGGSIAYNSGVEIGGLCISSSGDELGKFFMSGGSIEQNTATGNSECAARVGGVCNEFGTVHLSGNVNISGNVVNGTIEDGVLIGGDASNFYLNKPKAADLTMDWPIVIEGDRPLAATARVGITAYDPTIGFAVVTGTTDASNFFSDNAGYDVVADAANSQLVLKAHSASAEWSQEDGEHFHACVNGCGKRFDEVACSGGTATCTDKAVCEVCGEEYGTTDPSKHTGTKGWSQTATTHEEKWTCCGAVSVASEPHKWKDGACTECGYVCEHKDEDSDHVCDYCGETVSVHSGGTATCTDRAVCEVCGEEYGELDPTNHGGLTHVAAKAATTKAEGNIEYWHCSDCDRYFSDAAGTKEIKQADTVIAKKSESKKEKKPEKKALPKTGDGTMAQAAALLAVGIIATGAAALIKKRIA